MRQTWQRVGAHHDDDHHHGDDRTVSSVLGPRTSIRPSSLTTPVAVATVFAAPLFHATLLPSFARFVAVFGLTSFFGGRVHHRRVFNASSIGDPSINAELTPECQITSRRLTQSVDVPIHSTTIYQGSWALWPRSQRHRRLYAGRWVHRYKATASPNN